MSRLSLSTKCFVAFATLLGCMDEGAPQGPFIPALEGLGSDHPQQQTNNATADSGDAGIPESPSHLPCEIDALVKARCKNCHAPSTAPNRPVPLLTYADFSSPSKSAPNLTYAQQALQMVQTGMMPPSGALPPAEVATFNSWVSVGAPSGECDALDSGTVPRTDAGPETQVDASTAGDASTGNPQLRDAGADLDSTVHQCTSKRFWTNGEMRSERMHPGRACIACHTAGAGFLNLLHGPTFAVAGTVYPSVHEPDDCDGVSDGEASIVLRSATGQTLVLTPNDVGNFDSQMRIVPPYTAEIRYQGRVRTATTPQTSGDCNSCHTEDGTQGAPGRLVLP